MNMGRPPIGERAMTDAERQRRRREKLKMTTIDEQAKKLGHRIRRRRDGTFQLLGSDGSEFVKPMTMAEVKKMLDVLRKFDEQGITYATACGMVISQTPPGAFTAMGRRLARKQRQRKAKG
jgi:hypothetical protein